MTGPKPVALPAWLHPSVTKISLKVEILQCVAISSHVFFPEPLRHQEGGARIPEEPEEGRAAAAHDGGEGSLPQELLPESAKTGEGLENRRLKTVFKPMDGGSPVERFLRGTVYSAITRFCQWPVPFIPCRIGPRRGHTLPRGTAGRVPPRRRRRVQPLGARDEPRSPMPEARQGTLYRKNGTSAPMRAPARRAPARAEVRARGRSAIQAAPPRPRSPLRARPRAGCLFPARHPRPDGSPKPRRTGGKPWSACCFPDQCPLPRSGAPAPPPGLRASLSVSDGSASGRNTVSSSCHPLGRTPVIRRVRFTLHPIRSAAISIVPSSTPTPSRRVSRCLSDQFISSDFLLSSFAYERLTSPVQSWH